MSEALLGRIFVFWIRNTILKRNVCVREKASICFTSSYKLKEIVFK